MQTVIIASTNPVKIAAVTQGFASMFPEEQWEMIGCAVSSGVSHQPLTDNETKRGVITRLEAAKKQYPDAAYWVGIEGGVSEGEDGMESFAWVGIASRTGNIGKGKTGTFILPKDVTQLIREGKELGVADDIVFHQENSKQKMGAVGLLTNNAIDRTKYYTDAVILALIPFKNSTYYEGNIA